jgi:CheY-like chemotaxis protein
MNSAAKRILLVDLEDARRSTRVELLRSGGYEVRARSLEAEVEGDEGSFDLVIIAVHDKPASAVGYSYRPKPGLVVRRLVIPSG